MFTEITIVTRCEDGSDDNQTIELDVLNIAEAEIALKKKVREALNEAEFTVKATGFLEYGSVSTDDYESESSTFELTYTLAKVLVTPEARAKKAEQLLARLLSSGVDAGNGLLKEVGRFFHREVIEEAVSSPPENKPVVAVEQTEKQEELIAPVGGEKADDEDNNWRRRPKKQKVIEV